MVAFSGLSIAALVPWQCLVALVSACWMIRYIAVSLESAAGLTANLEPASAELAAIILSFVHTVMQPAHHQREQRRARDNTTSISDTSLTVRIGLTFVPPLGNPMSHRLGYRTGARLRASPTSRTPARWSRVGQGRPLFHGADPSH